MPIIKSQDNKDFLQRYEKIANMSQLVGKLLRCTEYLQCTKVFIVTH